MQAFNKIVYKSIPTMWLALFRKCSRAAKIAFGIKYFISTEMKNEGENFGA